VNFHLGISFSQARNQATHSRRITYGRRDASENMESPERARACSSSAGSNPIREPLITPRCLRVVCARNEKLTRH